MFLPQCSQLVEQVKMEQWKVWQYCYWEHLESQQDCVSWLLLKQMASL